MGTTTGSERARVRHKAVAAAVFAEKIVGRTSAGTSAFLSLLVV